MCTISQLVLECFKSLQKDSVWYLSFLANPHSLGQPLHLLSLYVDWPNLNSPCKRRHTICVVCVPLTVLFAEAPKEFEGICSFPNWASILCSCYLPRESEFWSQDGLAGSWDRSSQHHHLELSVFLIIWAEPSPAPAERLYRSLGSILRNHVEVTASIK